MLFLAFGRFDFHRNDFIVKGTGFDRLDRLLVAFQREFVQILTGKAMLLDQHFSAHELAELDTGIGFLQSLRHVGAEAGILEQFEGGAHRHPGHAFDAVRQNHVLGTGHDALRRKLDRLLRRAALPVDRDRGNAVRQFRSQHRVATNVAALFAALHDAAGDHILDRAGVKIIAVGNRVQRRRSKIYRMHARQPTAATASSGPDRINNIGFCHSLIPLIG